MPVRNENNSFLIKRKSFFHTCTMCEGSGKIHLEQADNNIKVPDEAEEEVCPLCDGAGSVRFYLRRGRRRYRFLGKSFRMNMSRRRGGRGRRFLKSGFFPGPNWKTSSWAQSDVFPEQYLMLGCPHAESEKDVKPSKFEEDLVRETVLSLCDDVTITIESKFGLPEVALDTDKVHINLDNILETNPILLTSYDRLCDESQEMLNHLVFGPVPPFIMQPLDGYSPYGLSNLSADLGEPEMLPVDPGLMVFPDSNVAPAMDVQLPYTRLEGAPFTSVVSPQMPGGPNPLDITGFQNQIGFDLNTNIVGPSL